jgi:hypothetical protein
MTKDSLAFSGCRVTTVFGGSRHSDRPEKAAKAVAISYSALKPPEKLLGRIVGLGPLSLVSRVFAVLPDKAADHGDVLGLQRRPAHIVLPLHRFCPCSEYQIEPVVLQPAQTGEQFAVDFPPGEPVD